MLAGGGIPTLHISPHHKNCLRRGEACNIALPVKTTILCYSFTDGQLARFGVSCMSIKLLSPELLFFKF